MKEYKWAVTIMLSESDIDMICNAWEGWESYLNESEPWDEDEEEVLDRQWESMGGMANFYNQLRTSLQRARMVQPTLPKPTLPMFVEK